MVYDRQPPDEGAKALGSGSGFTNKQISPLVSSNNFEVGGVSYEYRLCKRSEPRRNRCSFRCPLTIDPQATEQLRTPSSLDLHSEMARWYEHLQCWCLNFHRWVKAASVKNFQLIAPAGAGEAWGVQDNEIVIIQFGKIEDDIFQWTTMLPTASVGIPSFGYLPH